MTYSLSPYDIAGSMSSHMSTSHPTRRTSRSSGSQSGSHTYRVEKPRSNHNSPRTVERRKTTTGTKLYATLDDHYNMMMGITGDEAVEDGPAPNYTRPMSWHPSSTQFHKSSRNSTQGSDFYSLSARNSMYTETTPNVAASTNDYQAHPSSDDSDNSWPRQSYVTSSYSTPAIESMPWYLQVWARRNQAQPSNSRQGSNEFLPIQHPAPEQETQVADEDMEDSGKELVGMGLYDLPDSALSWGSSLVEGTGKGLKLEETWQPPEEEDDDDEADDEDDASSEDGEEELPPPSPVKQASEQAVNIKSQTPGSMEGQSFFFEEDDSVTKEWWYPQLRQPSLPVRDAGIGYGWL